MTRYLITGGTGMLGTDLNAALGGRDVTSLARDDLDITDFEAVRSAVAGHDVIINTAAYTRVDDAETDEVAANLVNAIGPGYLARAAAENGATLVQLSTDYVFDGTATTPYREDTPVNPVSVYGRTKAEGERLALELNPGRTHIVRTAWLYGEHGGNFAKTMLDLATRLDTVSVINDQAGQPTWTADLAKQIVTLLDSGAPAGVYHGTSSGETTWYGFARAVFAEAGLDPDRVTPTDSSQFVRPAPRPAYSVLGHDAWEKVGLSPIRPWENALHDAFARGALGAG